MFGGPTTIRSRACLLAIAVALLAGFTTEVSADSLSKQIDRVESKVSDLESQAEAAAEAYNEAVISLQAIDKKKRAIESRISRAQSSMGRLQRTINAMAVQAYTSGTMSSTAQLLLTKKPQDFLDRSTTLSIVAGNQANQLRNVNGLRLGLSTTRAELLAIRKQRAAVYKQMKFQRDQVNGKLGQAQKLLRSLQGKARKIYLARLAKRRAAQAAAAKKAQKSWSGNKSMMGKAPSAAARRAVTYALRQIGKPYVAFMAGERAFDCSGLTQAAYRHAGVSLPHFSKAQIHYGRRVTWGKMKPGDLMFFFRRGAHHVAIYIGGGRMVHAENPRSDVTISSINEPWYRSRFSGASRVVGR
jgi:peptidoglycan DL-endopeptidase CwlO